jgi:1-phosphofructokinase
VNVSAFIHALGGNSIAAGFAGGSTGNEIVSRLADSGINADFVHIASPTRTNLKVIDSDGGLTELNEPGPEITPVEWKLLEEKLLGYAKTETIFVLSGSLPRGLPEDTYRRLCASLRGAGAAIFLDADGEALKLALDAPAEALPDYIKPNRHEVLEYLRLSDDTGDEELAGYCRDLVSRGIKLAALSLGAEGALFITKTGVWRGEPLRVPVKSTVGAGDCMTGALVLGIERGLAPEDCFALAMAASAGAVAAEGTKPPDKAAVDELLKEAVVTKIG